MNEQVEQYKVSSLFEPFSLRSLQLRNRIVMAPMTRYFSPEGVPGEDVADYYRKRAAGNVGLIITEGVGVDHPAAVDSPLIPVMYGERALAGWKRVVERVHSAGGKIFPQLWHQGPLREPCTSTHPNVHGMRPSGLWGTPGLTTYSTEYVKRMTPHTQAMTEEDIENVIAAFGGAARNAMEVGFDGIAIHGAHGYLIDTFLWGETNKRTDRFGGTPLGRATFACEVVRTIRSEIGEHVPIMFRFSQHKQQDYKARFAQTPRELGIILGALSDAGVDIFDASTRRFDAPTFEGSNKTLSAWARELTGKPSVAVGGVGLNNTAARAGETLGVNNLDEVCRLHANGMFDLVAVGRALVSDPEWAIKARRGAEFLPYDETALVRLD